MEAIIMDAYPNTIKASATNPLWSFPHTLKIPWTAFLSTCRKQKKSR
jgi:hypothetical protein